VLARLLDSIAGSGEDGPLARLADSLVGMALGLALFLGSFALLWWNESSVARDDTGIEEVSRALVRAGEVTRAKHISGKLVYLTGRVTTRDTLKDEPYLKGVVALALERHVEMYQWIEERGAAAQRGGRKTHAERYRLGWAEGRIDSSRFRVPQGHANPPLRVDAPRPSRVRRAYFGPLDAAEILTHLTPRDPLDLSKTLLTTEAAGKYELGGNALYLRGARGQDALGDVRLTWKVARQGSYSVIARVFAGGLAPYMGRDHKPRFFLLQGVRPPEALLGGRSRVASTGLAIVLRLVGFLAMWLGLMLLAGPVSAMLDFLPLIGTLSRLALNAVLFVVAAVLSAATIALAMLVHHPLALVFAAITLALLIAYGFYRSRISDDRAAGTILPTSGLNSGFDVSGPPVTGKSLFGAGDPFSLSGHGEALPPETGPSRGPASGSGTAA
jgi:hypothetical protein